MTIEEFQKNGPLADPAFVTAVAAIKDATEARPGPYDANPVVKAALFDQRAGMSHFLTRLSDLTKPRVERTAPKIKSLAKTIDDLPPEQ